MRRVLRGCGEPPSDIAANDNWPSQSPWTTQHQRARRRRKRRLADLLDRLRLGCRRARDGVHLNNMLGETDLNVASLRLVPGMRLTSMMAPSLVLEEGVSSLVARVVGVGADPLGDRRRSWSRRARSRAAVQEAVELPRVHPEGDLLDCEGGIPAGALDELEATGERLGALAGLQHLLRRRSGRGAHARGVRGRRRSAARRSWARRDVLTRPRTGGERTADCLRSRCEIRTRLFEHPRVRSTLQTLRLDPRPAIDGFRA